MPFWISLMGWIEALVLLLLFGLSIWSISIIIDRRRELRKFISNQDLNPLKEMIRQQNWAGLKEKTQKTNGIYSGTISAALSVPEGTPEKIDRAVRSYLAEERSSLEKGFTVLATLGSNAPFIGLFGTVLGIIRAFAALAESGAGSDSVMAGISSALIATATGLFVAIPAVIAFNVFSQRLRAALGECEAVRDLLLSRWSG